MRFINLIKLKIYIKSIQVELLSLTLAASKKGYGTHDIFGRRRFIPFLPCLVCPVDYRRLYYFTSPILCHWAILPVSEDK